MPQPDPRPRPPHLRPEALALVVVGGLVGAPARYAVAQAWPASATSFPWATLGANLSGALILGFLLEALARRGPDDGRRRQGRLLLGTGFCGAYTTYSTFAVDIDQLVRHHRPALAVLYAAVTVGAGLVATAVGVMAAAGHHRLATADLVMDPDVDDGEGP